MTNKEAIVWCDDFRDNIIRSGVDGEKYTLALRAMRTAMIALAKQIPQKVVGMMCPNCERMFFLYHGENRGSDFCSRCGQALKWED